MRTELNANKTTIRVRRDENGNETTATLNVRDENGNEAVIYFGSANELREAFLRFQTEERANVNATLAPIFDSLEEDLMNAHDTQREAFRNFKQEIAEAYGTTPRSIASTTTTNTDVNDSDAVAETEAEVRHAEADAVVSNL